MTQELKSIASKVAEMSRSNGKSDRKNYMWLIAKNAETKRPSTQEVDAEPAHTTDTVHEYFEDDMLIRGELDNVKEVN